MAGFKNLKEISNNFEADLQKLSNELFSATIEEPFEDILAKKLRDLNFFRSKLRTLSAKPLASDKRITDEIQDEHTTIQRYEETVTAKVLEQQAVKFLMQSHAVKALITESNHTLPKELVERKQKIIEALTQFQHQETQLRQLDTVLMEKEERLADLREQWDSELEQLREMKDRASGSVEVESGPLDQKLDKLVGKMSLMSWLISKLVTSRSGKYDWLADPHERLRALKLARQNHTRENILGN